jgi:hypothetical protein
MISELIDFTDIDEPIQLRYVHKSQDAYLHPITAEITASQRQCSGLSTISKIIYLNFVSICHTSFFLNISRAPHDLWQISLFFDKVWAGQPSYGDSLE